MMIEKYFEEQNKNLQEAAKTLEVEVAIFEGEKKKIKREEEWKSILIKEQRMREEIFRREVALKYFFLLSTSSESPNHSPNLEYLVTSVLHQSSGNCPPQNVYSRFVPSTENVVVVLDSYIFNPKKKHENKKVKEIDNT